MEYCITPYDRYSPVGRFTLYDRSSVEDNSIPFIDACFQKRFFLPSSLSCP